MPQQVPLTNGVSIPTRRRDLESRLPVGMIGMIPKIFENSQSLIAEIGSIVMIDSVFVPPNKNFPMDLNLKWSGKAAVLMRNWMAEDESVIVMKSDS